MQYDSDNLHIWTIGDDTNGNLKTKLVWSPRFFPSVKDLQTWSKQTGWNFSNYGLCVPAPFGTFIPERQFSGSHFRILTEGTFSLEPDVAATQWCLLLGITPP